MTELIRFHLDQAGYEVLTASSGREAIETIRCCRPELVLLDLMLPDIDGFGVCEILRRNAATAAIPIMILSAWATTDSQQLGLELGALDYVTKPFSPRELVARINHLFLSNPISSASDFVLHAAKQNSCAILPDPGRAG